MGLHLQPLIPSLRMMDPLKIDKIQLILSLQKIGSLQTEMVTITLMTCDMTKPNTSCSSETKKNENLSEMPLMVTPIDGPTELCLTNSVTPSPLPTNKRLETVWTTLMPTLKVVSMLGTLILSKILCLNLCRHSFVNSILGKHLAQILIMLKFWLVLVAGHMLESKEANSYWIYNQMDVCHAGIKLFSFQWFKCPRLHIFCYFNWFASF